MTRCANCGAPEFIKRMGLCLQCYFAEGLHDNGLRHICGEHCPGQNERWKLQSWKLAAGAWR